MHELSFFAAFDQLSLPQNLQVVGNRRWRNSRKLARSPQVRISVAAVASNIANRVLSASAFDMFSICFVSITVPSVQVSSLPPISRGRRGLSIHLVLASVVPVAASEPKRSMGQYANTARPEIKRLATGPKTRESFELMR